MFGWKPKKIWGFLSRKTLVVFIEKACGVEFLKHRGAVNFSGGGGVDPPLARLCSISWHEDINKGNK